MGGNQKESGPGLVDRLKARVADLRERSQLVDHAVRMLKHMGAVQGTMLAGAVTYFGYLSFFPILVIAFSVVAYAAVVLPEAHDALVSAVESVFPGLIGDDKNDAIQVSQFAQSAAAVGFVALLGLVYSGLGWISAARSGLQGVFQVPAKRRRNFLLAKVVDLLTLVAIGMTLILSVGLSSAVTNVTEDLLKLLQFDQIPGPAMFALLRIVGVALGVAASTLLFLTMFVLLPSTALPRRSLLKGAFVGAIGFEVLKLLAGLLIGLAANNPATAVLGTSLVLLVWINYFSQIIMVGAAWAFTSPEARVIREREAERHRSREELAERRRRRRVRYGGRRFPPIPLEAASQHRVDRLSVVAGATVGATATAVVTAVRHRR